MCINCDSDIIISTVESKENKQNHKKPGDIKSETRPCMETISERIEPRHTNFATISMLGQLQRSRQPNISHALYLKRATTTTSATDSSASFSDTGPDYTTSPQSKIRQRDQQPCSAIDSPKRKFVVQRNRPRKSMPKAVTFGEVTVREYGRSIGDWWDVQYGLSLEWEYRETPAVTLPQEDGKRGKRSILGMPFRIIKAKWTMYVLMKRKRQNSRGVIGGDAAVVPHEKTCNEGKIKTIRRIRDLRKGSRTVAKTQPKTESVSYEDHKSTPKLRQELLLNFGFTSEELKTSEAERKLLRLEYSHWTPRSSQTPSPLFLQRCLANAPRAEQAERSQSDGMNPRVGQSERTLSL